ncbi:hypothetical protein RBB80_17415 [Tunturiibacter gelidiferens]
MTGKVIVVLLRRAGWTRFRGKGKKDLDDLRIELGSGTASDLIPGRREGCSPAIGSV